MTRYLMTLEDAIGLVMHAFSEGTQIFLYKKLLQVLFDLANALSSIFNYDTHKVIGTRHGEKYMKHYYQEKKWQER